MTFSIWRSTKVEYGVDTSSMPTVPTSNKESCPDCRALLIIEFGMRQVRSNVELNSSVPDLYHEKLISHSVSHSKKTHIQTGRWHRSLKFFHLSISPGNFDFLVCRLAGIFIVIRVDCIYGLCRVILRVRQPHATLDKIQRVLRDHANILASSKTLCDEVLLHQFSVGRMGIGRLHEE